MLWALEKKVSICVAPASSKQNEYIYLDELFGFPFHAVIIALKLPKDLSIKEKKLKISMQIQMCNSLVNEKIRHKYFLLSKMTQNFLEKNQLFLSMRSTRWVKDSDC